jgi:hypothetical protein
MVKKPLGCIYYRRNAVCHAIVENLAQFGEPRKNFFSSAVATVFGWELVEMQRVHAGFRDARNHAPEIRHILPMT